jgi:hypothetical protein
MSEPMPPMPTPPDPKDNRWIYWTLAAILIVLAVIGLLAYNNEQNDQEAQQKAAELTQKFRAAGLRVPADQDILIAAFGDDGGPVCNDPDSALGKAVLFDQLTNGADFVGRRPVIVDPKVVQGELLILDTYCPEKLEDFRDEIDDLKQDDVIKD